MNKLVIYKSSAGSGKTFTLVKEFLKLALRSPQDYRHILAVTFTNKATAEMKGRIIRALTGLVKGTEPVIEKQLLEEGREQGIDYDIKEQAQRVLDNILHDYSNFSVLTIDSFFHRIIRAFARELKLQFGYDVEMDQDAVITSAVDNLMKNVLEDEDLQEYLEEFAFDFIENDRGWNIEREIRDKGRELFKERYYNLKKKLESNNGDKRSDTRSFIKKLVEIIDKFEGTMLSLSKHAEESMKVSGLEIADFAYGKNGVAGYFVNSLRRTNKYKPTKRALEANDDPEKWYTKSSRKQKEIMNCVNGGLGTALSEAIEHYADNVRLYNTASELYRTAYVMGILNDMEHILRKYRDAKKVFLISDTNNILRSFITDSDAPFIYEKTGNVYKHYLIDEFQDTSTFQWENMLPLITNSLGSGYYSMIVGDVKQSIYRWRGGNMELLMKEVTETLTAFEEIIEERKLVENWRSGKNIIEFNNMFFSTATDVVMPELHESRRDMISTAFADVEQKYMNDGGYVKISFIEGADSSSEELREKTLAEMLPVIEKARADGYDAKDIMVLVRKNNEASEVTKYLFERGINVISSESLQLNSSYLVQFLVNIFKYLTDDSDSIARTQILYYFLKDNIPEGVPPDDIFTDYKKNKNSLLEKYFPKEFTAHIPYLNKFSLPELTEEVIRIFKLNKKPGAYLQRFQDMILEYSQKHNNDIVSFIKWWEENKGKYKVVVSDEEEAVSVLTIHKAKGLEKPVVIMPFANWDFMEKRQSFFWVSSGEEPFGEYSPFLLKSSDKLAETYFSGDYYFEQAQSYMDNLNLLYVGFTRAADRLYVLVTGSSGKETNAGSVTRQSLLINEKLSEYYDRDTNTFEYGSAEAKREKEKKEEALIYKMDRYISEKWQNRLIIRSKRHEDLLSESTLADTKESVNWDSVIAEALRSMTGADKIEKAVSGMMKDGIVNADEGEILAEKLEEILENEEVKGWFDAGVESRTGSEFLLPNGLTFKIDRMITDGENVKIILFDKGGNTDRRAKEIESYMENLEEAGYKNIEKFIYNVKDRKVVTI